MASASTPLIILLTSLHHPLVNAVSFSIGAIVVFLSRRTGFSITVVAGRPEFFGKYVSLLVFTYTS